MERRARDVHRSVPSRVQNKSQGVRRWVTTVGVSDEIEHLLLQAATNQAAIAIQEAGRIEQGSQCRWPGDFLLGELSRRANCRTS